MKPRTLIGLATVLVLLLSWYLATDFAGLIDRQRFPSPGDIVAAGSQIMSRGYAGGTLLTQALYSLRLVVLGFLVAALTGVPLGLMMGLSRRFEALVTPAFLLVRPIPPLAWIPLAIVWLGLADSAKVLVIWFKLMKEFYQKTGINLPEKYLAREIDTRPTFTLDEQLKLFNRSGGVSDVDKWFAKLGEYLKSTGTLQDAPQPRNFATDEYLTRVESNPKLKAFAQGK